MQNNYIDPSKTARGLLPMEWISVNDRLPELGQKVIAVCSERNMYRAVWLQSVGGEEIFWTYDGDHGFYLKYFDYWMPLPELPKEANNG